MKTLAVGKLSKAQLDERKKCWEDIRARLEYSGLHTKAELKIFESYYLKGTEPKQHPGRKDPIPLLYRLWLCPDQSVESWRAVTERLLAGPAAWRTDINIEPIDGDNGGSWQDECRGDNWGWQIQKSISETYQILWQHADSDAYDGTTPVFGSTLIPPLGFMGGAEQKLIEFLAAEKGSANYYEYRSKALFDFSGHSGSNSWRFYRDFCFWLDARKPHNPYMITYYMHEHWYAALSDDYMRKLEGSVGGVFYLNCYLQLLARFPKPEAALASSDRHVYAQKIRAMLDHRPIPLALQSLWLAAKNYTDAIDLNALEFKYPDNYHPEYQPEHYYVGEF